MLEVKWLHIEGFMQRSAVFYPEVSDNGLWPFNYYLGRFDDLSSVSTVLPHGRAVEMHHQPLWWVECQTVRVFDALHPLSEFRADKCRSGICRVYMEPHLLLFAYQRWIDEQSIFWLYGMNKMSLQITPTRGENWAKIAPKFLFLFNL